MIDSVCIEEVDHSNICVREGRSQITFRNSQRTMYRKVRVDGCVIKNSTCADYVVEKSGAAVVVELKGRGVEKGAAQVFETARLWAGLKRCERICAVIVGREYPAASSTMQVKKVRFKKEFNSPLHVINGTPTVTFDNVFKFTGHLET